MNAVQELEKLGYVVTWDKNRVSCSYSGPMPPPEEARPILKRLKEHKDLALAFLQKRDLAKEPARPIEDLPTFLRERGLRLTGGCEIVNCVAVLTVEAR